MDKEERYDTKKFTPPFRVGKAQGKAVLDSKGNTVIFFESSEKQAQLYCDYLNNSFTTPEEDKEQLELEIKHILDSGVNEIRLMEMFERFYDRRVKQAINAKLEEVKVFIKTKEKESEHFFQDWYIEYLEKVMADFAKQAVNAKLEEMKTNYPVFLYESDGIIRSGVYGDSEVGHDWLSYINSLKL